ncbi:MAG TPA: hypothetical protein VLC09_08375 [Polyangiaceae bacterium]|nr:hypothetical protein [Polyangiaceae bacterium]
MSAPSSRWLGVLLLASSSLVAPRALADEPEPVVRFDPAAKPPPSTQTTLLLVGTAGFALSYGGAVGASYLWESDPGATDLRYPLVGPWLKLGRTTMCVAEINGCSNVLQVIGAVATTLDGLLQAGSLAVIIEGILTPTAAAQSARLRAPSSARWFQADVGGVRFTPVPFVQSGSDLGLGLVGSF